MSVENHPLKNKEKILTVGSVITSGLLFLGLAAAAIQRQEEYDREFAKDCRQHGGVISTERILVPHIAEGSASAYDVRVCSTVTPTPTLTPTPVRP